MIAPGETEKVVGVLGQLPRGPGTYGVIGIVTATGGPHALAKILAGLPREFALPILVVQSMPDQFLMAFVALLAEKTPLSTLAAEDGHVPEPGKVYVAGTDRNLIMVKGRLQFIERQERVYDPKDALFRSMARELGAGAIAVVLTGMGSDGARGMKAVRDAGGHTIAQDKSTSLVYSTPRFAVEINAASESLSLGEIAPRLLALAMP